MTGVTLHARRTRHFNSKLQEALSLPGMVVSAYPRAASDTSPCVVHASSLGAEDMVISHMLDGARLDAGVFVLQTGLLQPETLHLLEQLQATSRLPISIYRPQAEGVVQLAAREGGEAVTQREVRFRTVGDITCTCPVASQAEEPTNTLGTNTIGRVALSLHEPIAALPYRQSRALGSLVLVDTASHRTPGAVMLT
jgi:3'-phosphoadenosine 5'-phosphosulfate sulfotransferase (PAPS reductase)/FAD synthetase